MKPAAPMRVGLLSVEPWDDVWRRNQHFAACLVSSGAVSSVTFVEPPRGRLAVRSVRRTPIPGVTVMTPPLVVPRRYGGHRVLGRWLRRALADVDVLWINDAVAGVSALGDGRPAVYDVTDDWRSMPQSAADRDRTIAAEDLLAHRARTVVCSDVLAERWRERYGIVPTIVRNGVDTEAINRAVPRDLEGTAPHAVYVGTLHANRIDVDLVADLAKAWPGTVHLVGPIGLSDTTRDRLSAVGVRMPGPVAATEVASWLVSADALVCPHLVDEFTLSLDAIKSHEYLATSRPVIATPSSGFQALAAPGLSVVDRTVFVDAVVAALGSGLFSREVAVDWDDRAAEFVGEMAMARA